MARIKIDLPEKFSFAAVVAIRITDLNYGAHVGNDAIMSILHEARVQYLHHHSMQEMDAGGVGLIMSDAAIEFKKELFYGESLEVWVAAGEFSKFGFDLFYKMVKKDKEKELVVVQAKTGMICFDYESRKIAALPAAVKVTLSQSP